VPLEALVNKFSHMRFEPTGYTSNPDIKIAKSVVDYIFRWMGIRYLPGYREANTLTTPKLADEEPAVPRSPIATAPIASAPAAAPPSAKPSSNGHASGGQAQRIDGNGGLGSRDDQFARFQLDAPSCDNCGAITVRNGNCYLCHNCGNSMGCS
jgi:ribonucleoside-diphosphate reductase alpha chain